MFFNVRGLQFKMSYGVWVLYSITIRKGFYVIFHVFPIRFSHICNWKIDGKFSVYMSIKFPTKSAILYFRFKSNQSTYKEF